MAKTNAIENTNLERSCLSNLEEFQVVHKQNFWIRTDKKWEEICLHKQLRMPPQVWN